MLLAFGHHREAGPTRRLLLGVQRNHSNVQPPRLFDGVSLIYDILGEQFRQFLGKQALNTAYESDQMRNYCFNKIMQMTGTIADVRWLKMNASLHGVSLGVEL